jgi:hypothetical protein
LAEAVSPNGQLIVSLIPELEFIIVKQLPVPDLPPREAQSRFQYLFRRFLGAFARPEQPLALFLDDLQWLDAATLELLERLITDPRQRSESSHPLLRTLEAIRKAGTQVQHIVLAPLRLDDISGLVADAMHCEVEHHVHLVVVAEVALYGCPRLLRRTLPRSDSRFESGDEGYIFGPRPIDCVKQCSNCLRLSPVWAARSEIRTHPCLPNISRDGRKVAERKRIGSMGIAVRQHHFGTQGIRKNAV